MQTASEISACPFDDDPRLRHHHLLGEGVKDIALAAGLASLASGTDAFSLWGGKPTPTPVPTPAHTHMLSDGRYFYNTELPPAPVADGSWFPAVTPESEARQVHLEAMHEDPKRAPGVLDVRSAFLPPANAPHPPVEGDLGTKDVGKDVGDLEAKDVPWKEEKEELETETKRPSKLLSLSMNRNPTQGQLVETWRELASDPKFLKFLALRAASVYDVYTGDTEHILADLAIWLTQRDQPADYQLFGTFLIKYGGIKALAPVARIALEKTTWVLKTGGTLVGLFGFAFAAAKYKGKSTVDALKFALHILVLFMTPASLKALTDMVGGPPAAAAAAAPPPPAPAPALAEGDDAPIALMDAPRVPPSSGAADGAVSSVPAASLKRPSTALTPLAHSERPPKIPREVKTKVDVSKPLLVPQGHRPFGSERIQRHRAELLLKKG